MGNEWLVFFAPIGALLFLFLIYRAWRPASRPYAAMALIPSMVLGASAAIDAGRYYGTWFFMVFALAAIPLGIVAHVIKWGVEHWSARNGT